MARRISVDEAREVAAILAETCQWQAAEDEIASFMRYVTGGCDEYRFVGGLGPGGKFYNDGDEGCHVGCYVEHRTPERDAMIGEANRRLGLLFSSNCGVNE